MLMVATAAAVVSVASAAIAASTTPTAPTLPQTTTSVVPPAAQPVVAPPAKPKTTLHLSTTKHFLAEVGATYALSGHHYILTIQVANGSGHRVGAGVLSCLKSTSNAAVYTCKGSIGLIGGIMLFRGTLTFTAGSLAGTITGGSGEFLGVSGTIKGSPRSNGTVALTANYS
jgi:hypothetical protein